MLLGAMALSGLLLALPSWVGALPPAAEAACALAALLLYIPYLPLKNLLEVCSHQVASHGRVPCLAALQANVALLAVRGRCASTPF